MKSTIAIFALLGILGLVSAITGVSSYSTGTHGTFIAYHPGPLSRAIAAGWGAYLLWLAFASFRRSVAAYWGGWALLVASAALMLIRAIPVILASQPPPPTWFLAASLTFVIAGTFLVLAYWGRWWHRQRGYFVHHAG